MKTPAALEAVFPRIGWQRFRKEYWPHRPLFAAGPVARMRGLEDLSTLGGAVALAVRSKMEVKAMLPSTFSEHNEIKVAASDMIALFEAGATLACTSLHRWHPGIRHWTGSLAETLTGDRSLGSCNLYVTPPGHGVPMHFDDHEILVIQLGGRKEWNFAPNVQVTYPTANSGRMLTDEVQRYAKGASLERMPRQSRRVIMRPGNALFLPRGYWHETDAVELSVSITFGIRTPSWAELLGAYLKQTLVLDPSWREPAWDVYLKTRSSKQDLQKRWLSRRANLQEVLRNITANDFNLTGETHINQQHLPQRMSRGPS